MVPLVVLADLSESLRNQRRQATGRANVRVAVPTKRLKDLEEGRIFPLREPAP